MLKAVSIYLGANDITSAILNQPCKLKCVIKALEGLSHARLTDPSNQEQGYAVSSPVLYIADNGLRARHPNAPYELEYEEGSRRCGGHVWAVDLVLRNGMLH